MRDHSKNGETDPNDDGLQDLCWFCAGFLWFYTGFIGFACGFRSPHPLPTQPSSKAEPMLMLLIERNVQKHLWYCYLVCFLGLEGPVLSSLTENGPK